jgi:hypothetical protein
MLIVTIIGQQFIATFFSVFFVYYNKWYHFIYHILKIIIHLWLKLWNEGVSVDLINDWSVKPRTHHNRPSIHNKDFVTIHNSVQPVSYCQHCAVGKLLSDGLLYKSISPTKNKSDQIKCLCLLYKITCVWRSHNNNIINSIIPSRNIGCLWLLSTSIGC